MLPAEIQQTESEHLLHDVGGPSGVLVAQYGSRTAVGWLFICGAEVSFVFGSIFEGLLMIMRLVMQFYFAQEHTDDGTNMTDEVRPGTSARYLTQYIAALSGEV